MEFKKMLYDVIVVGAGISGLAAARVLSDKKLNVLILEANNRMGGRIFTDRSRGIPIDLGASWAHDLPHNPLPQIAGFELELVSFNSILTAPEEHAIFDSNNERISTNKLEILKQFTTHFFEELKHQKKDRDLSELLDEIIFPDELISQKEPIKRWLANLINSWTGCDLNQASAATWQEDESSEQAYVINGYDHVINYLSKDLNILLQNEVIEINYSNEIITVKTKTHDVFKARKVVVTLPIGVLKEKKVAFIPELSNDKKHCIEQMGAGLLNKAVLEFPYCFWDQNVLSLHCLSKKDRAVFYVNYYKLRGIPILVALMGGSLAEFLENTDYNQQKEIVLSPLEDVYGRDFVKPLSISITHWRNEPFSKCSYSYLPRNADFICVDHLGDTVANKLFFAGEATHKSMPATVHGAYLSGQRAANEILLND